MLENRNPWMQIETKILNDFVLFNYSMFVMMICFKMHKQHAK